MNRFTRTDYTAMRTPPDSEPPRTRHFRNACLAYGAIVFASVAAAAAVVTDNVPLMVGVL